MLLHIAGCGLLLSLMVGPLHAAESFSPARAAVVRELDAAKTRVLMQTYSFTSAPIAKASGEAHKRGVQIFAVLDKSNETDR